MLLIDEMEEKFADRVGWDRYYEVCPFLTRPHLFTPDVPYKTKAKPKKASPELIWLPFVNEYRNALLELSPEMYHKLEEVNCF